MATEPFDPLNFWFCTVAGLAEFIAGRYDQAIGWLRKAQRLNARFMACHRALTASLALSGDIEAAQEDGPAAPVARPALPRLGVHVLVSASAPG